MKMKLKLGLRFKFKFIFKLMPDYMVAWIDHYRANGKAPNLKNPQTFNEKIQWLKLYYHDSRCAELCDKYAAKKFIAEKVGDEYNVPVLAVYHSVDEIDFDALPEKVVIKTNHDSGGVVVRKDKSNFNIQEARLKLEKSFTTNYYDVNREWNYKNIKPLIFAEEYLFDKEHPERIPHEYKLFYNYGKLLYYYITHGEGHTEDRRACFFDTNDRCIPCQMGVMQNFDSPYDSLPDQEGLSKMKELGMTLTKDFPFCRIDFYYLNRRIYVGEFTFTSGNGCDKFNPEEYDEILGKEIVLPPKRFDERKHKVK